MIARQRGADERDLKRSLNGREQGNPFHLIEVATEYCNGNRYESNTRPGQSDAGSAGIFS